MDQPEKDRIPRIFALEMAMLTLAAISGLVLLFSLIFGWNNLVVIFIAGIVFTFSIVMVIRLVMDPDSVRARQSNILLKLASQMLELTSTGLNYESARKICDLLLPSTAAIAVAITDQEQVLAYSGHKSEANPSGGNIKTQATRDTLKDGEVRVLLKPEDIGFSIDMPGIRAAIVVPLKVRGNVEGTLKFYFRRARHINETQKSIAIGLGSLLSTQMAAAALEEQAALAASMELRMLQSQINPHFLFNTINTIASFIRTDPETARKLLREFATFYRSTLEDSGDEIMLRREVEQTQRYFTFEEARFGTDRVQMQTDIDPELSEMMVPPFLIQPLVENTVRHAMPSEGKMTVVVGAHIKGDDVVISVKDDGIGMTEEERMNILHPESSTGMGIAVKNIHDRIQGYFNAGSHMEVESELGKGTCISLILKDAAKDALAAHEEAAANELTSNEAGANEVSAQSILLEN